MCSCDVLEHVLGVRCLRGRTCCVIQRVHECVCVRGCVIESVFDILERVLHVRTVES